MEPVEPDISLSYRRESELNCWSDVYLNLGQLCRICGSSSDFFMPIFDGEGQDHRLDLKIHMYLSIQVARNDILPLQMCFNCVSTILSWHNLFLSCQQADHKFQTMLGMRSQVGEVPDRQVSVPISPPFTSDHTYLSSHGHAELNLTSITQNSAHFDVVTNISSNVHVILDLNQSTPMSHLEPLPCADLSDRTLHHYNSPHEETFGQEVLDSVIDSELPHPLPTNLANDDVPPKLSNVPLQEELHILLSHVSTQTECGTDDRLFDEDASFLNKRAAISKKLLKLNSSERNDNGEVSKVPLRVSAIQSTSSSNILQHQENNCSRSKSVLVRNESVRPSVFSLDKIDAPLRDLMSSEMDTLFESGVIREHRNQERGNELSKGTMVSVVRPTCLRRAPTKMGVIENAYKDDRQHLNKSIENQMWKSNPVDGGSHYNSRPSQEECEDANADSLDVPSPSSSQEEDKNADQSHICFHCKKFISNSILLLSHEKCHLSDVNPPTSFICKFCSLPHNSINDLHSHYSEHETELDKQRRNQSNRKAYLCKQCGVMCTTEERLAVHLRLHSDYVESFRHECKTCGENFNTRSKLSVHLWSHALKPSPKTFKCHICSKGFSTKAAVMEHRLKHTDEEKSRAFKCAVCGMAFGNNTLLGKHRSTHSEEELARPFKCTFCGKAFARNHTLQIHHLSHSNVKSHLCSQCGKGFKMRNSLIQHMRTHQDPSALPTHPCEICGKSFKVKSRLRDHLRLHSGDKPFKCDTCGKSFHKVTALHTHEVSHTERRPYMCDVCGKAFKWSKNLRQHRSVHLNTGRVLQQSVSITNSKTKLKPGKQTCQCEVCGKQLSGKSSLRQHVANVHGDGTCKQVKSTICSICGKVLSNAGCLMRHMKITHGGVKAFKCDICEKEYSTKVARDDHRRSHTGERPYICSFCPKSFTSLSNLHIHRLIHSENRPHKCTYCDKQFKRRAHLVPHIRTHTGEKPYVCNVCSRGFAQSNDLHKHRLTHSNEKAFVCHCGMAYRIKRDLTRHQTKHHPPGSSPPETSQVVVQQSPSISVARTVTPNQFILLPGQQPSTVSSSPVPNFNVPIQAYENNVTQSVVVLNAEVLATMNS